MHPSCPLRPGKAAGMSKVRLWPPHPTPTSWGEQAPYHPGSQAHPALAQVSCPLDTVQQPAACVGVGAWRAPCEGRKGQEAPLPNPRRPPPTASASLERAARARAGAGEEDGLCWSQAVAELRAAWAQGCRVEPAGSAGKAVGLPVTALGWGAGAGLRGAPSAPADLGQAAIRGSSPERACLRWASGSRWDAEAVPTPLSARQGAGVRAGVSESRGLRQRGLGAVGGPALATLSPRFLDLVTVCS